MMDIPATSFYTNFLQGRSNHRRARRAAIERSKENQGLCILLVYNTTRFEMKIPVDAV